MRPPLSQPPRPGTRGPHWPPQLVAQPWLTSPAVRAVFACLAGGGFEARVVGGAVRNALLGRPIVDVDLATPALPEDVIRLATTSGLHAIPTGIAHGTVTVVSLHTPFEVTTLRRDVETFGRHARVSFTTDWTEDARRRDFTINALYCSADGTVHDPLGGWSDLEARRVRFIGAARDRIHEDHLRILRFFRFTAEYAEHDPDADGLAACIGLKDGLDTLSGERVRAEAMKLLVAPRAVAVTDVMARAGILDHVAGSGADIAALTHLAAIEAALDRAPDATLRLAALAAGSPQQAHATRVRLKLSNAEAAILEAAARPDPACTATASEEDAKVFIYRHGRAAFENAALLAWGRSGRGPDDTAWHRRFDLATRFPRPVLPVRGSDLVARGITPGPEVGRVLAEFEAWWIAAGFPMDPAMHSAKLGEIAAGSAHPH